MKQIDWKKAENVKLKQAVRLKETSSNKVKAYKAGDVVKIAGEAKHEILSRGIGEVVEGKAK